MITDKDIQKLKAVFATKDDLKSFATKDDLKSFATKDDLKKMKTEIFVELSKTRKQIREDIHDLFQDSFIPELEELDERVEKLENSQPEN